MSELLQLIANGLVTGSILAIAAVGVSLVYGILRIVNFAQGDLVFGAYVALAVNVGWGGDIVVAALAAVLLTAALAVGIEFALWRPLRRKHAGVFSLFIAAIGLALVLRHVLFLVADARPRRYGVDVFQVYELGPVRFSQSQVVAVAIAAAAIVFVGLMLARTGLGKAMRALSDNSSLAAVAGIDVDRTVVLTWIVAGGLAGIAGLLQALVLNAFTPNFGFTLLLPIFAAVVLGGIGSAYGALVGGLVLGLVTEVSTWSALAGGAPPVYKPVVAFGVLILVALIRPQGVFGKARVLLTGALARVLGLRRGDRGDLRSSRSVCRCSSASPGSSTSGTPRSWRSAPTDGHPRGERVVPLWAASLAAIGAAVAFGLPARAADFAPPCRLPRVTTIAFAEIVRYIAINEQRLTGGPVGTIALARPGAPPPTTPSGSTSSAGSGLARGGDRRPCDTGRDHARDRVGGRSSSSRWSTPRFARRGGACCARSGRTRTPRRPSARTCSPTSSRRSPSVPRSRPSRDCSSPSSSPSSAPATSTRCSRSSRTRSDPRRDGSELGAPVGAVLFGVIFAGTRFRLVPFTLFDSADAYLRLVVIGLILIALMLFRPQGLFGEREEMVLE